MRLSRRRPPDLFEEPLNPPPIPNERRRAMVEILKALLTEALSSELSTQIRREAQDEPDRN
jgi:hypothetical protein